MANIHLSLPPNLAQFVLAYLCAIRRMANQDGISYNSSELFFLAEIGDASHNLTNGQSDGVSLFWKRAKYVNERWVSRQGEFQDKSVILLFPLPEAPGELERPKIAVVQP